MTTHYMEEAEQLCDRVAVMDHGRIMELDSPAALVNKYFRETAVEFLPRGEWQPDQLRNLEGVAQVSVEGERIVLYSRDVPGTMAGLFGLASRGAITFQDMTVRQATLEDV